MPFPEIKNKSTKQARLWKNVKRSKILPDFSQLISSRLPAAISPRRCTRPPHPRAFPTFRRRRPAAAYRSWRANPHARQERPLPQRAFIPAAQAPPSPPPIGNPIRLTSLKPKPPSQTHFAHSNTALTELDVIISIWGKAKKRWTADNAAFCQRLPRPTPRLAAAFGQPFAPSSRIRRVKPPAVNPTGCGRRPLTTAALLPYAKPPMAYPRFPQTLRVCESGQTCDNRRRFSQ